MSSLILDENLEAALERVCRGNDGLTETLKKVSGVLQSYAAHNGIGYDKLRVLDVSTDGGEVNPKLLNFIQSAPRLPRQTEDRHRRYHSENASRIGQLIRLVTGIQPKRKGEPQVAQESILLEQIPDYLKQVLDKFPLRKDSSKRNIKTNCDRLKAITANGLLVLLALCRVAKASKTVNEDSPLNSLLVEHYYLVRDELRSLSTTVLEYRNSCGCYGRLIKSLDLKREIPPPAKLKYELWPQPFRDQYDQSVRLAKGEVRPDQSLLDSVDRHDFKLRTFKDTTIERQASAIAQLLPLIPYGDTLSVADLVSLEPTEVKTEEGMLIVKRNRFMDLVRDVERSKHETPGYDTENLMQFVVAVKGIAARTGYVHLIKEFNEIYKLKTDKKSRQARKAAKKKAITRKWLDKELDRLCAEFDLVVKQRLFERITGRKNRDADRAMRLCLFLVQVLTMRLLAYRQQAIRIAAAGVNIKFLPKGVVVLLFSQHEVKNNHTLYMELRPTKGGTHERLRKLLIAYYRIVWPYVQKHGGGNLGRHFFACFEGHSGRFRAFRSSTDYVITFKRYVNEFIRVHELESNLRNSIHPHFLRGVCADWMVIDLGISKEDAAEVLGDTPRVLDEDYLDQDRVYDATPVFDRINAARRSTIKDASAAGNKSNGRKTEKEYEARLRAKEKQIEVLTDALDLAKRQYSERVASLEAQLSAR